MDQLRFFQRDEDHLRFTGAKPLNILDYPLPGSPQGIQVQPLFAVEYAPDGMAAPENSRRDRFIELECKAQTRARLFRRARSPG